MLTQEMQHKHEEKGKTKKIINQIKQIKKKDS